MMVQTTLLLLLAFTICSYSFDGHGQRQGSAASVNSNGSHGAHDDSIGVGHKANGYGKRVGYANQARSNKHSYGRVADDSDYDGSRVARFGGQLSKGNNRYSLQQRGYQQILDHLLFPEVIINFYLLEGYGFNNNGYGGQYRKANARSGKQFVSNKQGYGSKSVHGYDDGYIYNTDNNYGVLGAYDDNSYGYSNKQSNVRRNRVNGKQRSGSYQKQSKNDHNDSHNTDSYSIDNKIGAFIDDSYGYNNKQSYGRRNGNDQRQHSGYGKQGYGSHDNDSYGKQGSGKYDNQKNGGYSNKIGAFIDDSYGYNNKQSYGRRNGNDLRQRSGYGKQVYGSHDDNYNTDNRYSVNNRIGNGHHNKQSIGRQRNGEVNGHRQLSGYGKSHGNSDSNSYGRQSSRYGNQRNGVNERHSSSQENQKSASLGAHDTTSAIVVDQPIYSVDTVSSRSSTAHN